MRDGPGVLLSDSRRRSAVVTAESVVNTMTSSRFFSFLALGASLAIGASGCAGAPGTQPPVARAAAASFAQRQAAAHAQGRWLTEELSSVKLTPVPNTGRSAQSGVIVPVCDTDCG